MGAPLFSVVIPSNNRAELVVEAVASVLNQSSADLEVVVVDDGSTDDTKAMLERSTSDSRLSVVSTSNVGAAEARNIGVRQTSAPYVAFLDSDDLFLANKLAAYGRAIEAHPDAALFHSFWTQHDLATGKRLLVKPVAEGDARHDLLTFSQIATPTVVVKRTVGDRVGWFRKGMFLVEDYDLWCRASACGEVVLLREPLSIVRVHESNTERVPEKVMSNQVAVVEHYFDHYRTDGLRGKDYYIANSFYPVAHLYFVNGKPLRAAGLFWKALTNDLRSDVRRGAQMIGKALKVLIARIWLGFSDPMRRLFWRRR